MNWAAFSYTIQLAFVAIMMLVVGKSNIDFREKQFERRYVGRLGVEGSLMT